MKFTLSNGTEGLIKFSYPTVPNKGRTTMCQISIAGVPVATAHTSCHVKDNFSKESGRKRSLTRAISGMIKTDRTAIWQGYFQRLQTTPVTAEAVVL